VSNYPPGSKLMPPSSVVLFLASGKGYKHSDYNCCTCPLTLLVLAYFTCKLEYTYCSILGGQFVCKTSIFVSVLAKDSIKLVSLCTGIAYC